MNTIEAHQVIKPDHEAVSLNADFKKDKKDHNTKEEINDHDFKRIEKIFDDILNKISNCKFSYDSVNKLMEMFNDIKTRLPNIIKKSPKDFFKFIQNFKKWVSTEEANNEANDYSNDDSNKLILHLKTREKTEEKIIEIVVIIGDGVSNVFGKNNDNSNDNSNENSQLVNMLSDTFEAMKKVLNGTAKIAQKESAINEAKALLSLMMYYYNELLKGILK